nr:transglycosylase domain-containing protein [bacterium]
MKREIPLFTPRTKKPAFALSLVIGIARVMAVIILVVCASGAGALLGVARAYMTTAPTLDINQIEDSAQTTFIYDANGQELTSYKGLENRIWATLDEIPQALQNAFIAIEDVRFYSHFGVDLKRLFGALISNLQSGTRQGGSTITQQLIKMRITGSESSYKRKLQEAYLAIQLERTYTKEQILEAYLNTIPLGGANYGVKAAALDFFNKDLDQLTLRECATLAGLTRNPSYYNPRLNYYTRNKPEQTDNRTNVVLKAMYDNQLITKEEYDQAMNEKLYVVEKAQSIGMYDMAYAVEYAVQNVIDFMLKQRNLANTTANRNAMEREIRSGGYHIYTTIDPDIQHLLEDTVMNWTQYPTMRYKGDEVIWTPNADGTRTQVMQPQAAAVILSLPDVEIKAVMGGRTLPTQMKEFNRAYQSTMPVGSSIKPLAVFGPAMDKGYSPATIIANIKAPISGWDSELGYPKNYSEAQYNGACTIREGVRRSLNVVAARTLLDLVGINTSTNYLEKLGINRSHILPTGSGLALGSSGITPLEMSQAYCAVANSGQFKQAIAFTKITDSKGNTVLDPYALRDTYQVFKPGTAWMLLDTMKDVISSTGTGWRANFPGMTIAGKTGTNTEERGVSFTGITPYYVSSVWIGSDAYKPLASGSAGGNACCPLWKAYMQVLHQGLENRDIIQDSPESLGLVKATVCKYSGKHPSDACPSSSLITDWFHADCVPTETCDMHQKVIICKDSGKYAGPYCPAESCQVESAIVLPMGSIYRTAAPADLQFSMPGALLELPNPSDVLTLPEGDTRLEKYCSLHTPQSGNAEALSPLMTEGQEVYAKAKRLARLYQGELDEAILQQIGTAADNLLTQMQTAGITPQQLQAALDEVKNLLSQHMPYE